MTLKNLLVAYNGGEASDTALHLGALMSRKYDAHLTGIVAHGVSNIVQNFPPWLAQKVAASLDDIIAGRVTELEDRFRSYLDGKVDPDKQHWIDVHADPDRTISFYTRMFDVTVLGQYENLPAADEYTLHPDRIAHASGRPILVAPKRFRPTEINESAVIAWDGKRNASRALFDAMNILETKRMVTIVTVGDKSVHRETKGIDLPTLLVRHGVEAKHVVVPRGSGGTARTILDFCMEQKTGLLVMGAFGHSKLSEDLFGGVTKHILREAEIPVFVSH
ncbi:universal stress protein [Ruegeria arenilitoris]|uniref:universal stress protein n=1 Tax=Ruegeria arenilitoris TaxID=1173585 RepID=UPI00147F3E83|nr:universal stress protein [Ruegeria arenilitoris]